MREQKKTTTVEFDVVNKKTGEMSTVDGIVREENKYYSIRDITTRINQMEFTKAITEIATTPRQGKILSSLLDMVDADNRLVIINQTKLAAKLDCSRDMLKGILKRLSGSDLAVKEDRGLYHINPFIYIGKRTRSNEAREGLQDNWYFIEKQEG